MSDPTSTPAIARASADPRGPLAWMARNSVAANLLMLVLMVGGVIMSGKIKQEVFPEFDMDIITVSVPYPGATPEDVESGIILAIEEAVRGIDGVKEVTSSASEGAGSVTIELLTGADADEALSDVRSEVDRIQSFPADVEAPTVSLARNRRQVASLVIYGDLDTHGLHELAEYARSELLAHEGITLVEVTGIPAIEMSVEIPRDALRSYGLTHQDVATTIANASLELPAGSLETPGGDRLVRLDNRIDAADVMDELPLIAEADGTTVTLGEVATVIDGFQDTDLVTYFNGQPAVMIDIYRVGDETPITVSDALHEVLEEIEVMLPEGVDAAVWSDRSEMYRGRMDLLMKNAKVGLVLVLLLLGFFLEVRLAFWVTMGIPISFLGALIFMPMAGVSLNMISLFAFILTLGIVVDDAIVVGEAVFKYRQSGHSPGDAALMGLREVAAPVTFSVLTTVIAFMPLLSLPGGMGKFMAAIPAIVIIVLLISLVESLLILPAHLGHLKHRRRGIIGAIDRAQERFAAAYDRLIDWAYGPLVTLATRLRYATLALGIATLLVGVGWVKAGKLPFSFLPRVESEVVNVTIELPAGAPIADTQAIETHVLAQARAALEELGGEDVYSRGILSTVGATFSRRGTTRQSHLAQVSVFLVPADDRPFGTGDFSDLWRERVGEIAGVESIGFDHTVGPGGGSDVSIELQHEDQEVLEAAAEELAEILRGYSGVREVDDGFGAGKEQLSLHLLPNAQSLGLTEQWVARQVRSALYGAEATRHQRGREELRVYVRLPEDERASEFDLESLMIRTPVGGEVALADIATVERGIAYTSIRRVDGRRALNVTADVVRGQTTGNVIVTALQEGPIQELMDRHHGLSYDLAGEQRNQRETFASLRVTMTIALFAMFALMAVSFKSYVQPIIVMIAIPFGIVGAIAGHVIMNFGLSMMSLLGIVALSGVVVNDSLVMVTATNDFRVGGMSTREAAIAAGKRRFRPIMLTSMTTFLGLSPMILETSTQARFLIPMAISLGFGVIFTTFVTLFLVPALYVIIDDVRWFFGHSLLFTHHDVAGDGDPGGQERSERELIMDVVDARMGVERDEAPDGDDAPDEGEPA